MANPFTERREEAGAVGSVGSRGDSYDNALAETVNGFYKAELIRRQGAVAQRRPSRAGDGGLGRVVEPAPPHSACGHVPPAEYEVMYYREQGVANPAA